LLHSNWFPPNERRLSSISGGLECEAYRLSAVVIVQNRLPSGAIG
jgi:hypothetical protein